ncbi:PREDICTED: sperm-associated antigen 1 [Dipodomys ordii]|uniref:Sperm-associated antigen 1 n=1 Tax=Dipodomys ordii TaxID=10020 RepID=A0A1S3EV99_DIPOR|nr:PREDICTED: sperm-associated antigen 1 [Dipodomys ordii]
MTTKDCPSLWSFGTTKKFKIPIEHLDFKYIEKCSDIKHLEKILCVLRSGEEGYYPELTEFCEKRLTGLAPGSRALRKDKPAATPSSFTKEEWETIDNDLKSWMLDIKNEENTMHSHHTELHPNFEEDHLPPVRGSNSHPHVSKGKHSKSRPAKKKVARDYSEWDKFDVEKECSKIDEDSKEKTTVDNKAHLSKIETRLDISGLTEKERGILATREKEKGNEAFNSKDYEEAVMYYTRSLSALPTVAAYNNRAQAEIKLQNWNSAFQDCEKVLELEPGNIKALLRRATTYKHQNKFQEALEDLTKVLDVEPDNELAKKTLSEVERDLKNSEPALKTQTKGRRMVIEEVENSEDDNGKERRVTQEDGSGDQNPAGLKNQGNELFKNGQFAEAARRYAAAIEQLEPAGSECADALSILYSNRAACYLKEGNCGDCIQDCNRALELHPFSMKPLLRRAMAYETLEQYGKAYVDYKTVLQIDYGIQLANDSINRITKILIELDGPNWREKLPPIPTVPTSEPFRAWCPAAEMTPDQAVDPSGHPPPSVPDETKFKALKEEGNQYVKDKDYKGALSKYSECLKINNQECAIYTNRALCYLKLGQFEEAKQDCDQALHIDGDNVKACYRRALAQKGLKNFQESLSDLNKVLLLDPNIVEAKMELEEVTRLLSIKDNTATFSKEKERKKIEIQEVSEGNEEEPEGTSEVSMDCLTYEKGEESNGPPEPSERLPISKPNNAYEFGQVLNAINTRKDEEACAHLLGIIAPEDLPMFLSNKLEGDTFLLLIQSLKNHLIRKDPFLVYQHLLHLSTAERFKMMLTLISKAQKEQTKQLFDDLSDAQTNHFSLEDVQALKEQYEL